MTDGKKLFAALQRLGRGQEVITDDLSDALRLLLLLGDRASLSAAEGGWIVVISPEGAAKARGSRSDQAPGVMGQSIPAPRPNPRPEGPGRG